jgi:hypothetical protein
MASLKTFALISLNSPVTPLRLLQGKSRSLEAVPVDAQLSYFRFKCLSWNSQLNGGAGWTPNHAFGFPECGFEHFFFVLGKVSNERNRSSCYSLSRFCRNTSCFLSLRGHTGYSPADNQVENDGWHGQLLLWKVGMRNRLCSPHPS